MLDILIPSSIKNARLIPDCINSLVDKTDVPFRIVVIIDGGVRNELVLTEAYLKSATHAWKLLHNQTPVYLNQSIHEGIQDCSGELIVLCCPQIMVDDDRWFGKMQQIFSRDPSCGIVDTSPNTKSRTLYPVRRARVSDPGCRFAMLRGNFARGCKGPIGMDDPVAYWQQESIRCGQSFWTAPGVGYAVVEHKEHELWRAPLETPSRSGSRSRMIPG